MRLKSVCIIRARTGRSGYPLPGAPAALCTGAPPLASLHCPMAAVPPPRARPAAQARTVTAVQATNVGACPQLRPAAQEAASAGRWLRVGPGLGRSREEVGVPALAESQPSVTMATEG